MPGGELGLSGLRSPLAGAEDASGGLGPPAGTGDQFCPRGREAGCASSCRNAPASAAAHPKRGREERQGCEQELRLSRCPVCGRWLCRPHPVLVLSPRSLHKECLIKNPRLDSLLIP